MRVTWFRLRGLVEITTQGEYQNLVAFEQSKVNRCELNLTAANDSSFAQALAA